MSYTFFHAPNVYLFFVLIQFLLLQKYSVKLFETLPWLRLNLLEMRSKVVFFNSTRFKTVLQSVYILKQVNITRTYFS